MEAQVSLPTVSTLLNFLNWDWSGDTGLTAQAELHLAGIVSSARSYTRGKGFTLAGNGQWTVCEDIAAVILSCAARSLANPTSDKRVEAGSFNSVPGSAASWSLVESFVLNRYRRRASAGPARAPDQNLVSIFEANL